MNGRLDTQLPSSHRPAVLTLVLILTHFSFKNHTDSSNIDLFEAFEIRITPNIEPGLFGAHLVYRTGVLSSNMNGSPANKETMPSHRFSVRFFS